MCVPLSIFLKQTLRCKNIYVKLYLLILHLELNCWVQKNIFWISVFYLMYQFFPGWPFDDFLKLQFWFWENEFQEYCIPLNIIKYILKNISSYPFLAFMIKYFLKHLFLLQKYFEIFCGCRPDVGRACTEFRFKNFSQSHWYLDSPDLWRCSVCTSSFSLWFCLAILCDWIHSDSLLFCQGDRLTSDFALHCINI